jgi:hypothetical protein
MQRALLNRATMRVADTTEVSGRVTADSREKETMKSTVRRWVALISASLGLYLGLSVCGLAQNDQGQNDQGTGIKLGVPNGTYAFQDSGYVPPAPGATTLVPLEAAGRLTFFANGTTSGLVSFSIGGTVFSHVRLKGTFTVNADGSVSETETQLDSPGLTLHFDDYPTPDGNTITFVATDTGAVVSGFDTRGR